MSISTKGREQVYGRMNQCFALLEQIKNTNSCDWLELDGEIDPDTLLMAAKKTIARHPMAQSVYKRRLFWFTWVNTEQQLPIEVEMQKCESDDDEAISCQMFSNVSEYSVLRKEKHPFRFILLSTPSRNFLQILTTHVYTDGRSANIFTTDLMRFYNALHNNTSSDELLKKIDVRDRNHDRMFLQGSSFFKKVVFFIQALVSVLQDLFEPTGRLKLPKTNRSESSLVLTEIATDDFEKIKQNAKLKQVTLHPCFLRAFVRTIEDFNHERQQKSSSLKILDNFSLRRFSSDPMVEKLYDCISVPYTLKANLNNNDEQIEKAFNKQLDSMKDGGALMQLYKYRIYHWMALLMPKAFAAHFASKVMIRTNVICTNVGVLDPELKAFGQANVLSYISFPVLIPPGEILFQLSSFQGKLRLLTLYHTDQLSKEEVVNDLVNPFLEKLSEVNFDGNEAEINNGATIAA
ncbi:condensation domain-containing protein [Aliikangiella sp. IMCC44359]|uniref:condensation domain-containing protein n=1 Tax=Aliikangiella sp. IMCC44359 TaxID=3459125 RepID=UPI00403B080A